MIDTKFTAFHRKQNWCMYSYLFFYKHRKLPSGNDELPLPKTPFDIVVHAFIKLQSVEQTFSKVYLLLHLSICLSSDSLKGI